MPAERINVLHPWLSRYHQSKLLSRDSDLRPDLVYSLFYSLSGPEEINTTCKEVYGDPSQPVLFCIGNGGAGYTGLLEVLTKWYIETHGNDFRIGWVTNHSRHSQIALLGNIVQVALTYEPQNEDLAIEEGWACRVCTAFHDHFILVGNKRNTANIQPGTAVTQAIWMIGKRAESDSDTVWHTRQDGSATFVKEQKLLRAAGVDVILAAWMQTHTLPPYEALEMAAKEQHGVYMLTDRSTYLTAKRDGVIPDIRVYAEGGKELLNPCSALINTKAPASPSQKAATDFAGWLSTPEAQQIIRQSGQDWDHGKVLFTGAGEEDFAENDGLTGLSW